MPFSEDYFRARALQTALEWMLFQLVSQAKNPAAVLADFQTHMNDEAEKAREVGMQQLLAGKDQIWSNLSDSANALDELRDEMIATINIS